MSVRRLLIELVLALAVAAFAMAVGEAYGMDAQETTAAPSCAGGLPALAAPPALSEADPLAPPEAACTLTEETRVATRPAS